MQSEKYTILSSFCFRDQKILFKRFECLCKASFIHPKPRALAFEKIKLSNFQQMKDKYLPAELLYFNITWKEFLITLQTICVFLNRPKRTKQNGANSVFYDFIRLRHMNITFVTTYPVFVPSRAGCVISMLSEYTLCYRKKNTMYIVYTFA